MLNRQKHQVNLRNILVNLYKDSLLANILIFKGGTAAYFFYDLPRFSTDLNFDMMFTGVYKEGTKQYVYDKVSEILEKFGYEILDVYLKRNTLFWLISYEKYQANIKIEISTRTLGMSADELPNYSSRNYYGESVLVVEPGTLVAQKLIAVQSRRKPANRDLFDANFFLNSKYAAEIDFGYIEKQTGKDRKKFLLDLYTYIGKIKNSVKILNGLGEVLTEQQREWVKSNLLNELKNSIKIQIDSLD